MTKSVAQFAKGVQTTLTKHAPEILTGIGIAGMFTTTVLAVKATPKAVQLIDERKRDLKAETLPPIETIKTCWKCYIPAAVTGVASATCLIGASSVSAKRTAALAAAYHISETALTEYRNKVLETIGEKKEKVVREAIAKDKIEQKPVSKNEVVITPRGNTLCFDSISGRYFRSDIDIIKRAENEINKRMLDEMYISLSEFYDELGLDHTSISDELGWKLDDGLIELIFSSQIADDGTPCIVVDYRVAPRYDYNRFL